MAHRFLIRGLVLAGCLGLALAGSAAAQDITGTWDFTVDLPGTCTWTGTATFTQSAGTLTGSGNLPLTAGDNPLCPPVLTGDVSGTIAGTAVTFGLTTPGGDVNFTGTSNAEGSSMTGTWTFGTLAGTWSAAIQAVMAPSLPEWGMLALLSAVLVSGAYALRRKRSLSL